MAAGFFGDINLPIYTLGLGASNLYLMNKLQKTNLDDLNQCNQFFQDNKKFGLMMFFTILLAKFY